MRYLAKVSGREIALEVIRLEGGRFNVRVDGRERRVDMRHDGATMLLTVEGRRREAVVIPGGGRGTTGERVWEVTIGPRVYPVGLADPLGLAIDRIEPGGSGRSEVRSVMPGRVVTVLVQAGDVVSAGQGVVVVEAMKMENTIVASRAGRVVDVKVRAGEAVETGMTLVVIE